MSAGRLAALMPAARKSMYTSALSITVFSVLLARFNPAGLAVWLMIRVIVSAACLAIFGRLESMSISVEQKIRWLAVLMGLSGVVWGVIPAFIRPEAPEWQAVVILWLFGNQAVITAVASPARPVFLAAMGSVTMIGALTIGVGGGAFGRVLATLLILGGAYSAAIFASLHRAVEATLVAKWEVGRLAETLAERQAELESANEVLAGLAARDSLTGLLNRRALTTEVTAGSETESLAGAGWIGFFDVDRFKAVNDTYGHRAGDEVLVALGQRWAQALDETALLARAGGDEFIMVLAPCSRDEAERTAQRALAALTDPIGTSSGAIHVTCSIGLAEYRDGEPLTSALARADRALYEVKLGGRRSWAVAPWDSVEPAEKGRPGSEGVAASMARPPSTIAESGQPRTPGGVRDASSSSPP